MPRRVRRATIGPDDPRYFWKTPSLRSFNRRRDSVPATPRRFPSKYGPRRAKSNSNSDEPKRVDPWVQAQLSTDQVRWLNNQDSAVNQVELLKSALAEWVVRHPESWFEGTRLSDAIRLALTEFIDRHKDEFIALD